MHFAIITYGSRGDVQPYISLALGLMERGHKVTLLAPENFKGFAEGYGIDIYTLHGNLEEMVYSEEAAKMLKTGNMISFMRFMQKASRKVQPQINQDIVAGTAGAEVLIANVLSALWVASIAEKFNKKWGVVQVSLPTTPTKKFPFAGLDVFNFPAYNIFSYRLIEFFYWQFNKKAINGFRQSLGLPTMKRPSPKEVAERDILNLYAISPQFADRPKDWNSNTHITGYLTLPAHKKGAHIMDQTPKGLTEWLQSGEKPVYIGFGSIPVPDPEKLSSILNDIITKTNLRIILCTGWSVIPDLPVHPNLFATKYANHQWLLPQCITAVIHGGAGTTAAVLKAKIPVIVVSIFADQPWWGKIIEAKNLGAHIPFKKLGTAKLLGAIKLAQTPAIVNNVIEIGEKINDEDGLELAATIIENYFNKP